MKSRAIIPYGLLLLVPTLGAGCFMFHLLKHESERLAMAETAALQNKARVMADEIALSVDEAKDGLMASLRELSTEDLPGALGAWSEVNPLIRNVFIWDLGQKRLILPDAVQGITSEQAEFTRRYEPFFGGGEEFRAAPASDTQQAASTRQQLRQISKSDYNVKQAAAPAGTVERTEGWLSLYIGDEQLHLLGWQRDEQLKRVYGLEIEMAALLGRIVAGFAEKPPAGQLYAILDGNGHPFAQRTDGSPAADDKGYRTVASVSLSPQLPHWQVAIQTRNQPAGRTGYAAMLSLVAVALVMSILAGGSVLLWQARRNLLEAQQRTSFVANVSHELKTPLTTIRMYAEMLAEGRIAAEEKRRGYLETMVRESQRLTRLVNNVLDFSRLEQGRKKYQTERLDLAAAAHEVLASQADRLHEAGLTLATEFPDTPAPARLDRDAFSQCLLNLVDNAIKYANRGTLAVRLAAGHHGTSPHLLVWRLEVEDEGPGIPGAHRGKLFEQFHRADDSLTAKVAGFGLGLSISRRLLRDQGGDLVYEAAPSGGARFVLIIPGEKS